MTAFAYSPDQRQAIIDAIPLRPDADPDSLIQALTEAAEFTIMLRRGETARPYATKVQRELDRFRERYEKLEPFAKDALTAVLGGNLAEAIEQAKWRGNLCEELPVTGRRPNEAAITFVLRCAHRWREYSGKEPPKRPHVKSPFYLFVEAAMPSEVLPVKDYSDISGTLRLALRRFRGPQRWSPNPGQLC